MPLFRCTKCFETFPNSRARDICRLKHYRQKSKLDLCTNTKVLKASLCAKLKKQKRE